MAFNNNRNEAKDSMFEEKVVQVSRVSKKTKGGNQFGFSILVVVGDKKGKVGVGLGKGKDVLSSIKKAVKKAKKAMISVPMDGTTVPFPIAVKKGAAKIILKPAPKGSGVIAGGAVRSVVEAAGIRDLSAKILGTNNQASNVYATFAALHKMQEMVTLKNITLKSIVEVEAEEEAKLKAAAEAEKGKTETKETKKPVKTVKTAAASDKQVKKGAAKVSPKKTTPAKKVTTNDKKEVVKK